MARLSLLCFCCALYIRAPAAFCSLASSFRCFLNHFRVPAPPLCSLTPALWRHVRCAFPVSLCSRPPPVLPNRVLVRASGPLCSRPEHRCVLGPLLCSLTACSSRAAGPLCSRPEHRCENGGVCQEDWTGERTVCLCPEGFSGELCEVTVQPCITNPCQNNGRCSMTNGRETCTCTIGERMEIMCPNQISAGWHRRFAGM